MTAATIYSENVSAVGDGYGENGYGNGLYGGGGPTVTTEAVTDVTAVSATLNGTLSDLDGADSAACYFEWRQVGGTDWNATTSETLSTTGSFSASLTGFDDSVDYEYRAVADAADGESTTGSTVRFTTSDSLPAVTTDSASSVTASAATLNGSLDSLGNASSAECYFEWREADSSSWNTTAKQSLSSTGSFSADISNLTEGVSYAYRAVTDAVDGDAATGSTLSFSTSTSSTPPTIDSYSVSEAGKPDPHLQITTNWSVSDADGDLDTVIIRVTDGSGTLIDAGVTEVTGSSASLANEIKIRHQDSKTVDVTLTVVDTLGNSTSQTESVTE
ncbi:hypothetical protein [Haloarcula marina]|uniref:hypothetical protein n=1 Tax=Haloarcula marina TaxID=2961574 RepID=UPI0020B64D3B|nr:hypothetical protein [Halomicroarcula marina]